MAKRKRKVQKVADKTNTVSVIKRTTIGTMPVFIQMAHRSLEKSKPEGRVAGKTASYSIAKDLLKVTITDHSLLEDVEGVELSYSTEGK